MARRSVQILNDRAVAKVLNSTIPGPLAARYLAKLDHWIKHKGPEWTALRLKALWNVALLLRSGQKSQIPQVLLEARIAQVSGLPKGVERALVLMWASVQRPSRIRAMALPFRVYTGIRLTNESRLQVEKSRKSINTPRTNPLEVYPSNAKDYYAIRHGKLGAEEQLILVLPFGKRVKPKHELQLDKLSRLSGTSSYPNLFKLRLKKSERESYPYLSMCASMLTKGRVPNVLVEKFGDFQMRKLAEKYQRESGDLTYGKITIIQEGGAKGRVVCSPNAWVQYYCYPYHKYLIGLVKSLEVHSWDLARGVSCALDQVRGVHVALNRLNTGSTCHAVDLSSATDRFPLELQQALCEEVGIPEFSQALEELKGPYRGLDDSEWSYAAGQPMGLYGSFPLFHLTHYAMLNALALRLGKTGHDNFCVLGDDVLIFDDDLLELYLKTLEEFEVPISWHKSYEGNLVEFAGFLITKSGATWTAFRPYKYANHGEMSSVLNVLHAVGAPTRDWSSYWARAYSMYQRTQGLRSLDLSPLAPEEPDIRKDEAHPGLGWFGSLFTRLTYYPTTVEVPLDYQGIDSAWHSDRYTLCQTEISVWDPYYYGTAVPDDIIFDNTTFSPEQYVHEDRCNKRKFYQMFWQDPLVRTFERDGDS